MSFYFRCSYLFIFIFGFGGAGSRVMQPVSAKGERLVPRGAEKRTAARANNGTTSNAGAGAL